MTNDKEALFVRFLSENARLHVLHSAPSAEDMFIQSSFFFLLLDWYEFDSPILSLRTRP